MTKKTIKTPQRYYFYYRSFNVRPNGSPIGFWESRLANSKKEILDSVNTKGRQYANHVSKVYTAEQAAEIAKTDRELTELMKLYSTEAAL